MATDESTDTATSLQGEEIPSDGAPLVTASTTTVDTTAALTVVRLTMFYPTGFVSTTGSVLNTNCIFTSILGIIP